MADPLIDTPTSPALDHLCERLSAAAGELEVPEAWPKEQLKWCGDAGVYRWFFPVEHGGFEWSTADIYRGYLRMSAACLTTTFVITQRMGACQRILAGEAAATPQWLPRLVDGSLMTTLGISHLTTSRQHVAPVLAATPAKGGYHLSGYCPWVTGGRQAELLVVGATLNDGRQILAAVDSQTPGVEAERHAELVALTSSQTGKIVFDEAWVPNDNVLAGPVEHVMKQAAGAGTGGLQTSILAAGLAATASQYLEQEAARRANLREVATELSGQVETLQVDLLAATDGRIDFTNAELRTRANSLALRTTQAAMTAAKGAGFTASHPVGRWCREALFFLVWSCPEPVLQANLCELAQIG
jgi:alkylation response protein AidB-like acyl-CoA dehydrogenase